MERKPKPLFKASDYAALSDAELDALEHGERYRLLADRRRRALEAVRALLGELPRTAREQAVYERAEWGLAAAIPEPKRRGEAA